MKRETMVLTFGVDGMLEHVVPVREAFEANDTRRDIVGPAVVAVETALEGTQVEPDFVEETTVKKGVCWKHGGFFLHDSGQWLRLPVWQADCVECGR